MPHRLLFSFNNKLPYLNTGTENGTILSGTARGICGLFTSIDHMHCSALYFYTQCVSSMLYSGDRPIRCYEHVKSYLVFPITNDFVFLFLFPFHISCSTDERDRVQKKTFTKWVNKHLIKVLLHTL